MEVDYEVADLWSGGHTAQRKAMVKSPATTEPEKQVLQVWPGN